MQPKHPRDSETIMSELMMPQHANIMGNVFGGVVLSLVDRVAAVAAIRHASKPCVTVSVDKVDFKEPIHVGELLTAYARVNFAGRSSMEVGVKIIAENVLTGVKRHTNSCYVTYVALDEQGVPTQVPPIVPETPDEKRRPRCRRSYPRRPMKSGDTTEPPSGAPLGSWIADTIRGQVNKNCGLRISDCGFDDRSSNPQSAIDNPQ